MATVTYDEAVPLSDLRPHPRNPRRGDVGAIAESLRVNGQYRPIVVSSDGYILAGNHTFLAAQSLRWETIQVMRVPVEGQSPEGTRILLADNRTGDLGGYADDELLSLLQSLEGDYDGSGFAVQDVELLEELLTRGGADPMTEDEWEGLLNERTGVSLIIEGLDTADVSAFRALPGGTDAERLRLLLEG